MRGGMEKSRKTAAAEPVDERVGFSFYEEDLKALRDLLAALRPRKVRVPRTYFVRALVHVVSEDEMFAHAVARHRQEQAGKAGAAGEVEQHLAFNLFSDDVDKLSRVGDKLADQGFRGVRSFIIRSLIHAPWELDALARQLGKFQKEFPDPRSREGRARRHRG